MGLSSPRQDNKKCSIVLSCLLILILVTTVVLAVTPFISFSPRKYKIGVLYGSNEGNYISAVLQAEREIKQLSSSHGILANIPELSLELRNVSSETREEAIRRLGEEEAVSVYLGHPSLTSLQVGAQVVDMGASRNIVALAYLHTMNRTLGPGTNQQLHVLPVLRNDSQSLHMLAELQLKAPEFPRLTLLPGLVHSPTLYPRSDTQDLLAAMIRECVLRSHCDILIISHDHLDLLLRSSLRTSIRHSRWWLVSPSQQEEKIRKVLVETTRPSVMTLSYVGEKREQFILERFLSSRSPVRGSVYSEWEAYNTVVRLHRALAQLRADREEWTDEKLVGALSERESSGRFVVMSYTRPNTEMASLPNMNWQVLGVLEVNSTRLIYKETGRMILSRQEVERMYQSHKAECPEPEFLVRVDGRGVIPTSELHHSLTSLPSLLSLTVAGTISLDINCNLTSTSYTCTRDLLARVDSRDTPCLLIRRERSEEF